MFGIEDMANMFLRNLINHSFNQPYMTVDNLVTAIRDDKSLWNEGEDTIKGYVKYVPSTLLQMAQEHIGTIDDRYRDEKYDGFTNLTLMWLREDQPPFYSVIINTEGGTDWLDSQVSEILKGVGITRDKIGDTI
jgi:hypothetical protein